MTVFSNRIREGTDAITYIIFKYLHLGSFVGYPKLMLTSVCGSNWYISLLKYILISKHFTGCLFWIYKILSHVGGGLTFGGAVSIVLCQSADWIVVNAWATTSLSWYFVSSSEQMFVLQLKLGFFQLLFDFSMFVAETSILIFIQECIFMSCLIVRLGMKHGQDFMWSDHLRAYTSIACHFILTLV